MHNRTLFVAQPQNDGARRRLVAELGAHPPHEAAALLADEEASLAFEALAELNPSFIQGILAALPDEQRQAIIACAPPQVARQWERNRSFETGPSVVSWNRRLPNSGPI